MSQAEAAVSLVLCAVFLVLSAFFSSSEAAFLSLQKSRLAHLVNTGVPGARRVAEMIRQPERLLSTVLLGNNLVNVAFTALVTVIIISLLREGNAGGATLVGTAVATVVATTVLLLLGETIPKTIAVRNAERVAFLNARPLKWFETLLWPLVVLLQRTTHRVSSIMGGPPDRGSITEAELRTLIDLGEAEGTFQSTEAEMLANVFRFGDRQVQEVITPRTEMVTVPRSATLREFLDIYVKNPHTRFPVCEDTVDNVVGVLSAKDILMVIHSDGITYDDSVTDVMRDPYFVPETKRIAELFDELRHSGNQMALVVDEYGGIAGLVTLKQLLEEVVGDVGEEGGSPEEEFEAIDKNTFQVDGGMVIGEVNEELSINLPQGDFETIAGFVLDVLGRIPSQGEQFEYANLKFEITKMANLKIETIKVTKPQNFDGGAPVETAPGQARRDPAQ